MQLRHASTAENKAVPRRAGIHFCFIRALAQTSFERGSSASQRPGPLKAPLNGETSSDVRAGKVTEIGLGEMDFFSHENGL